MEVLPETPRSVVAEEGPEVPPVPDWAAADKAATEASTANGQRSKRGGDIFMVDSLKGLTRMLPMKKKAVHALGKPHSRIALCYRLSVMNDILCRGCTRMHRSC